MVEEASRHALIRRRPVGGSRDGRLPGRRKNRIDPTRPIVLRQVVSNPVGPEAAETFGARVEGEDASHGKQQEQGNSHPGQQHPHRASRMSSAALAA